VEDIIEEIDSDDSADVNISISDGPVNVVKTSEEIMKKCEEEWEALSKKPTPSWDEHDKKIISEIIIDDGLPMLTPSSPPESEDGSFAEIKHDPLHDIDSDQFINPENYSIRQFMALKFGIVVLKLWTHLKEKIFGKKVKRPGGISSLGIALKVPFGKIGGIFQRQPKIINILMNRQRNNKRIRSVKKNNKPKRKNISRKGRTANRKNFGGGKIRRNAPLAIGTQLRTKNAQFFRSKDGSIRITHREPLGLQLGYVAFTTSQFSVNPGLVSTFPWLSRTAINFEAYRFNKLSVEYITSVGANVGGSICIAPDYNSSDAVPNTLQQMEQYQDAWRDVVWEDGVCIIRPSGMGVLGPKRYIRAESLPANLDIKTYDVCTINIGTSGLTVDSNATQIGELWINYDVELSIPNSYIVDAIIPMSGSNSYVNSTGTGVLTTNLTGPLADNVSTGYMNISSLLNVVTLNNLAIGGSYFGTFSVTCETYATALTISATSGCTIEVINNTFTTTVGAQLFFSFSATAETATLTFGGATTVTSPSGSGLYVMNFPL